ncbi:2-amino-4-hydroxy-6-hydroxymethyldihydropteridinediphosphokinase [soil metagenome]
MKAYIALGSNLADPILQVQSAIAEIGLLPQTHLIQASSLYRSKPMGPQDQADFINAVVAIETSLSPQQLLTQLQTIERQHQRLRELHWGPRTLDLDFLLYGNQIILTKNLVVPHYGMHERNFVLYPLAEIAPDLILPKGESLQELLKNCPLQGLERIF